MFENCTGVSWKLFVPCGESIEVCEVETCEQVSAEIDMYRIGDNDRDCTIRLDFRHPVDIIRRDVAAHISWSNYIYAVEVSGSCWDRCEAG